MYALFLIDFFPGKSVPPLEWQALLESLENIEKPSLGVQKIFGSAWLIDLNESLSFFHKLQGTVQDTKLPYRVAFFEKEPKFAK
jgi:hypothetical protein